jgi:hypothetical protein
MHLNGLIKTQVHFVASVVCHVSAKPSINRVQSSMKMSIWDTDWIVLFMCLWSVFFLRYCLPCKEVRMYAGCLKLVVTNKHKYSFALHTIAFRVTITAYMKP